MISLIVLSAVFAAELALVALSFNLAYRVVGFANFAHVEIVTVGAFAGWAFSVVAPLPLAAVLGAASAGVMAVALNMAIFDRLRATSIGTRMIASAGAGLALRGLVQWIWGVDAQRFDHVSGVFTIGTTEISFHSVVIVISAIACVVALAVVLKLTGIGRNIRAAADNPTLTEIRGVPSRRIINQVWFISGAIAGLAGVLIGLDTFVRPELGLSLLVPMFAAAIVGGVGSPFGAILGATMVSVAGTAAVTTDFGSLFGFDPFYLGSQFKSVVAFLVLVAVIAVKPSGFFGIQGSRV